VARLGGRQDPELRQLGRADHDEARGAEAPHQVGVVRGPVAGEEARAEVHAEPGGGRVRLDRDRHAGERPAVLRIDGGGLGHGVVAVDLGEGAKAWVDGLDPAHGGRDRLAGGQVASPDARGHLDGGEVG
jgi:hypothetical protein